MALYEQVPYTNFHGVNLAWILANVKDFDERLDTDETRLSAAESSISDYGPRITKNSQDIGTVSNLETTNKSSLVAAINELVDSGGYAPASSYISLTDKPQINGVTLSGNKTTANLNVSYNDLTNRPQINGVTLSGNKSTADLGVSYDALTGRPQLNGVTLSGNKTTADLSLNYEDLTNRPINTSFAITLSANSSRTITLSGRRTTLLVVGGHTSADIHVVAFLSAYQPVSGTPGFSAIDLDSTNTRITFTGDSTNYKWTFTNTASGTYSIKVLAILGSATLDSE